MNNQLITKEILQQYVSNKPYCMVVIYSDSCSYCRKMKIKLGSKLSNTDDLIFLEDNMIAKDLRDFYPHIRIYRYGIESTATINDLYKFVGID